MHNYAIASTGRILPPELLLEVFMQNAAYHETDDWPIDTTLNCSQVCKLWRMIILGCSSLWGQFMQVHMFEGMKRSWAENILSRTGNGSLWVHGFLSLDTHHVLQYLVDKWENVQTMNVEECAAVRAPLFNWSFLLKEAPNLQSLSVFPFQPTPLSGSPLFNNIAPRLKALSIPAKYRIEEDAPWLSNLESITFQENETISKILSLLKCMPNLKNLHIKAGSFYSTSSDDTPTTPIHLPKLQCLQIFQRPCSEVLLILETITASPDCALLTDGMEAMHDLTTTSHPSAQRMCSAILKWVIPYMTRRQLKFLALDVAALGEHVRVLRFRETSGLDPGETICPVSFDEKQPLSVEIPLNPHTAPAIKELASSSAFSSVQQLIIFSSGNEHKLIPIFKACSSVKELIIDIHNAEIGALFSQSGSETAAPLFPYLHTIQMRDVCPPHWAWPMRSADYFPSIFEFLEHRVEIGFPVSLLDLSYHVDVDIDELPDHYISQLNDIKGLAIKLAPLISYDTDSQESD